MWGGEGTPISNMASTSNTENLIFSYCFFSDFLISFSTGQARKKKNLKRSEWKIILDIAECQAIAFLFQQHQNHIKKFANTI